jgi:hypothetical protein
MDEMLTYCPLVEMALPEISKKESMEEDSCL